MKKMLLWSLILMLLCSACGFAEEAPSVPAGVGEELGTLETGERPEAARDDFEESSGMPDQSAAMDAYSSLYEKYCGHSGTWENAPDSYSGAYIDNEKGGILTICVTDLSEETKQIYFDACGTEELAFKQVAYSYHALQAAMDAVSEYNETHDTPLCYGWGVDEMNNCVPITVSAAMESEALALQADYPAISVTVDAGDLTPSELYDIDGRVTLTIQDAVVTSDTEYLECMFYNGTDGEIHFGRFRLDTLADGEWYTVPYRPDVAFADILPVVQAGEEMEVSCWLAAFSTEFPAGTYRLCLPWCVDYAPMQGRDWDHMALAEFTVTD